MLESGKYNFPLYPGCSLPQSLTWAGTSGTAYDLSAYTAQLLITDVNDPNTVLFELSSTAGTSGTSGYITVSSESPNIEFVLTPEETTALQEVPILWYQLLLQDSTGIVSRLLSGKIFVTPQDSVQ